MGGGFLDQKVLTNDRLGLLKDIAVIAATCDANAQAADAAVDASKTARCCNVEIKDIRLSFDSSGTV